MTYSHHPIPIWLALAVLPACANDEHAPEAPEASELESSSREGVVLRRSADGELVAARVVDTARVIEVKEGGRCGVSDQEGVLLSCEPGTQCVSLVEGSPGACVAGLRAPRQE